jgi:hypothetical protein
MYILTVYVPEDYLDVVKTALFTQGAGRYQEYDCCSWQTLGQGQFRPLENSDPFIGNQNELTQVAEYRVEMICVEDNMKNVIKALKEAHPYEEPAYNVVKMECF